MVVKIKYHLYSKFFIITVHLETKNTVVRLLLLCYSYFELLFGSSCVKKHKQVKI